MSSPYDKSLTSVGLLEGGKIQQDSRDQFISEIIELMITGNASGLGGSSSTRVFSSIVPLPPDPGPSITNVTTLESEKLFWFDPDPAAVEIQQVLQSREKSEMWHSVFVDVLYEKTAAALDMPGSTPLFPVFDASGPFGVNMPLPFTIPELAAKLKILPPKLAAKLVSMKIELKMPSLPTPPIPPKLPEVVPPPIPGIIMPGPPPLVLPDLITGLIKIPFDLLKKLVLPPALALVLDVPGLPKKVLTLAMELLLALLVELGMLTAMPRLLAATLMIWIKNIVAMICVNIISALVGSGGIAAGTAKLTGLIK